MTLSWLPRRLLIVLLTASITALITQVATDFYARARMTVLELADHPVLVPAARGTVALTVVPVERRTERERMFLFFGRTWYLTTYRIEIENHDALPPIDGRLVVDGTGVRVFAFEEHPLLDPAPAPGGQAGRTFAAARYRDAVDPFAIDLRLPPPGARLGATLTVVSRHGFAAGSAITVELGHPGGVLRAAPVPVVWTSVE